MLLEQLRRRLMVGLTVGVVVTALVVVASDASAFADALGSFDWRLVPAILALSLGNYTLRFVKWQYYLALLDARGLTRRDSLLIFTAGFTMVMTPGKVGEVLKSYLVRARAGVPMARTAPIIVAERLTDGCAMMLLAGIGIAAFRYGWQILLVSAVLVGAGLTVVQRERWMLTLLHRAQRTRLGKHRADALESLYISTRRLLRPRPFALATAIGVVSWFGECVALYLVLIGLGLAHSWHLLLAATFVFAAASWIGGLSLLPGGLGASEASIAGLLLIAVNDADMNRSLAGSATLLIRFATLWFGTLLGVIALWKVSSWPLAADADATEATGRAPALASATTRDSRGE